MTKEDKLFADLLIKEPAQKLRADKYAKKDHIRPLPKKTQLNEVGSWRILGELGKRHIQDLLLIVVSLGIGIIIGSRL